MNSKGKLLLMIHLFTRLYLGCYRGDLIKTLQRHRGMMGVKDGCFFFWQIALYGSALSRSCTKLRNRDFVSMFAERIEDGTL